MCDSESTSQSPLEKKCKRSFSEAWLTDNRCKSWIRKVPLNDSLFHCTICNKDFSCNTRISRHVNSTCHKNNIEKIASLSLQNNDIIVEKNISHTQKFRQEWLDIELFKPWLREASHDKTLFFCAFCEKYMDAYVSHIYRHADSETHIKITADKNIKKRNEEINITDELLLSFDDRKKAAEIRYAMLIAEKNISHQTAKEILTLFQQIGKDSKVLESMSMSRTKCNKIISNVLGPVETDRVVDILQNEKFSIFIDETSDITNQKWMTFHCRYVDPKTQDIRSQLVKLINIDAKNSNAENLFHAFKNEIYKLNIPFLNIVALSCDNASVMIGKNLSFKKKLEEMCPKLLTFSCPCHSAALIAHAACSKIPHYCEEFKKKIATYINSSPKRSAIFVEFCECFQEAVRKILKLSDTRWLARHACIDRVLEYWDTIKHFLRELAISEKSDSAEYLLCIMEKLDVKAYLLFLKHILNFFNTFNAFFQALETRIHLLQPKSFQFLITICKHFIKPELLKNISINFEFLKIEHQKSLNDIYLGTECEKYLDELVTEGHTEVVANVRQNCLQFYITAAQGICKRLPINHSFLSKLKVFEADTALRDPNREVSFNNVSFIAQTFGGFDDDGLKKEWFALHQDFTEAEKDSFTMLNLNELWKKIFQHTDRHPNLKSLLNAVRSLPNSNADSERIFSYLPDLKTKKTK